MLKDCPLTMTPKSFAVGVRIEHPQSMINDAQYGQGAPASLPAAAYKLTSKTAGGRGVYTFCMCPGGYVVDASSEEGKSRCKWHELQRKKRDKCKQRSHCNR